jgi:hypothetical protein
VTSIPFQGVCHVSRNVWRQWNTGVPAPLKKLLQLAP